MTLDTAKTPKSIADLDIEGRRVFLRLDLDVPLDSSGAIEDDSRIRAALPTVQHAIKEGARVIIGAHLGDPPDSPVPNLSLAVVGDRLAELLNQEIMLPEDCVGDGPRFLVNSLREGQVVLLENLRFHPGERSCDDSFSRQLAALTDVYVNEAFGACHEDHASIAGAPHHVRQRGAGFLLLREIENLRKLLDRPKRPYVAVIGGTRAKEKLDVISALLPKLDAVLIGGVLAATCLLARGVDIGASIAEPERVAQATRILAEAQKHDVEVILPIDHVVRRAPDAGADSASCDETTVEVVRTAALAADHMVCDIGPDTRKIFAGALSGAHTIFWYGPMGLCEQPAFSAGTEETARLVAHSGAFAVVGGGAAVAALTRSGLRPFVSHVTSGDAASLAFLQGRKLLGLEALVAR